MIDVSYPPMIATTSAPSVHALIGFGLNSSNARRLAQFYEEAFGARVSTREPPDLQRFMPWNIKGRVAMTVLRLGEATLELLEFDHPGRPYPQDLAPEDTRFQHFGIVVTDMQRALQRLSQTTGWTAISTAGPQKLPENAGGVTAFKFRDPDGHPLEFLQFAAGKLPVHWRSAATSADGSANESGIHRGIDHSALSVADAARSVRFYESMGLKPSSRTLNQGSEQERLDGVPAPIVDVIGLAPPVGTPHVELLHYRTTRRPVHEVPAAADVGATRLIFAVQAGTESSGGADGAGGVRLVQDPDGHFLQLAPCEAPGP